MVCSSFIPNNPNKIIRYVGITPKAQPLDVFITKVFKGHFRDLFQQLSLTAPKNEMGIPWHQLVSYGTCTVDCADVGKG
jgi:hypothetical protein